MKFPFQNVALIGKHHAPEVAAPLLELAGFLSSRGLNVVLDEISTRQFDPSPYPVMSLAEIGDFADLAVVLGGDGTMLSIARTLAPFGVPLVGVNLGRLGFLTDLTLTDVQASLSEMLAGQYVAEQRVLLSAQVISNGQQVFEGVALNEVMVHRFNIGSLIEFEVRVDGEYLYTQRGDGLIVATPTGSTAYAMSAGGTILHPGLNVLELVPICPHTLTNRPIAISGSSHLEIQTWQPGGARVRFDGHISCDLQKNDQIRIAPHQAKVCLLHPVGHSYYHTLREKLHWNRPY